MGIQIDRITGRWEAVNGEEERMLNLTIQGTDQMQRTVTYLQTYNAETGEKGEGTAADPAPGRGKSGREIGVVEIGLGDGTYRGRVKNVTGRHALYFVADDGLPKGEWTSSFFEGRVICELEEFVFLK